MIKSFIKITQFFSVFMLTISLATSGLSSAESSAGKNASLYAAANKPGIIEVETHLNVDIKYSELDYNKEFSEVVFPKFQKIISDIEYDETISNKNNAYLMEISEIFKKSFDENASFYYEIKEDKIELIHENIGFFINSKGDIMTSAAAIYMDENEVIMEVYKNEYMSFYSEFSEFVKRYTSGKIIEIPAELQLDFKTFFLEKVSKKIEVGKFIPKYTVMNGSDEMDLDLIISGEPFPNEDLAILRADTQNHPTVFFPANPGETSVKTGMQVSIITKTGGQQIHAKRATIGAEKPSKTGETKMFSLGGDFAKSQGGSPIVDEFGRFLGVLAIAPSYEAPKEELTNGYVIPASEIQNLLDDAKTGFETNEFTSEFREAVSLYDKENFAESLVILKKIEEKAPANSDIKFLIEKIENSNEAGVKSTDKAKSENFKLIKQALFILGLALVLFVLIYVLYKLISEISFRQRIKRKKLAEEVVVIGEPVKEEKQVTYKDFLSEENVKLDSKTPPKTDVAADENAAPYGQPSMPPNRPIPSPRVIYNQKPAVNTEYESPYSEETRSRYDYIKKDDRPTSTTEGLNDLIKTLSKYMVTPPAEKQEKAGEPQAKDMTDDFSKEAIKKASFIVSKEESSKEDFEEEQKPENSFIILEPKRKNKVKKEALEEPQIDETIEEKDEFNPFISDSRRNFY